MGYSQEMKTYIWHITERTFENLAMLFIGVIIGSYLYWGGF
jgi:hypothetical protein